MHKRGMMNQRCSFKCSLLAEGDIKAENVLHDSEPHFSNIFKKSNYPFGRSFQDNQASLSKKVFVR